MAGEHDNPADEPHWIAFAELAELSGLSEAELRELVDYGALSPGVEVEGEWRFAVHAVTVARTAHRLGVEFDLEPPGVALLLAYVERVRELEAQVCALKALLPR